MSPAHGLHIKFQWAELLKETKAQSLKSLIETNEKDINTMMYELYGLSKDQIAIIESSN